VKAIQIWSKGQPFRILLDDADFEWAVQYTWHKNEGYASRTSSRADGRKNIRLHREMLDVPSGCEVDHINRNRLDNRRKNLRIVGQTIQRLNSLCKAQSGFKGVRRQSRQRWSATISVSNLNIGLGSFSNPKEAYKAYCQASRKFHGYDPCTNRILE